MTFFKAAGVSEEQLRDDQTRQFIYNFLDQHGGVDKAIASIRSAPSAPKSHPVCSQGDLTSSSTVQGKMAPPSRQYPKAPAPPPQMNEQRLEIHQSHSQVPPPVLKCTQDEYAAKIKKLEMQINSLKGQLENKEKQIANYQTDLSDKKKKLQQCMKRIRKLEGNLSKIRYE